MKQVHVIILSYDNNEVSFIMENPHKLNLNENRHMFGKLLKLKYYMHAEILTTLKCQDLAVRIYIIQQ